MADRIILDPAELATGRTELDITPWIKVDGVDWGDGDVEAYRSSGEFGEQVIDYRLPNRQITMPLVIQTRGGTAFATIRSAIQAKGAIFQREGGWLKRITSSGGTLYADVQLSGLKLSGSWLPAFKDVDPDAQLTLEVSPDFYGNEITLADHTETSAAELVFTETSISGDYPARVRVVVDEDDADAQLGLIWGFRRRNYSSAATARLQYEAEALQPLDTAARAALSGASGGTVVTHGTLSTNWTPVLGMNMAGTAYLTHAGTYRWWCRYRTTSGTAVQIRGVYDVGDLVLPEENPRWTHPAEVAGTAFYIADLGQIRLDQIPVGTHRWAGQIQGKGQVGTENVSIDRVWFQPLDESAGILRAPVESSSAFVPAPVARDEFNQTVSGGSDPLVGLTAPVGGVWAGAGGGTDFVVEDTGHTAQRTTTADGAVQFAISGLAASAAQTVQVDVMRNGNPPASSTRLYGVVARYTDTSNYVRASVIETNSAGTVILEVTKVIAGVATSLAFASPPPPFQANVFYYTFRLQIDAVGRWWFWYYRQDQATSTPWLSGQDSALATGGALASGKMGFRDFNGAATAATRNFDNFTAWVPTPDAVLNPSQSLELRHDGIVREDVSGSAYGPVSWVEGDLPRLPPTVGATTEVFIKGSRGDFQSLPDLGIDDISARITYRPCWLHPNS